MIESTHSHTDERTIDWSGYWRDADESDRDGASPSAHLLVGPVLDFLDDRGGVASLADIGCGAGATAFAVAERYPDATVVGYDAAEPVLADDRKRAREEDLSNTCFERSVLPDFDPDRQFDVVCAFYTLCYVSDVERALANLYDAVAPGGTLLVTYHNRLAQAHFRSVAASPEEHLGDESPFDPERYADRFELVIEGESLLSYDAIHETLGTWPRSVWSVVGKADRYGAWRHNPLVYVPK